ncbi:MAG TPA: hypothetical protein PK112_07700, partial [candidate division Zixibacteria bacterium]|nr:hypothetical protein [candidate division Zixibacteria bacterium]
MARRRKIPTKGELLQLQKLYKTDEKIGERLGGVPAYLVAYWRRKKNVAKHSVPKFSEAEVRNLWERFGDDDRCGLELGISKAAFYNWRRRYGIREKPPFLKLEQLELNLPGLKQRGHAVSLLGKQSAAQKIIAMAAEREKVEVGELVVVQPDVTIAHQDAAAVVRARLGGRAPQVGLILGSGLGGFADRLADPVRIDYGELPGFPVSKVHGHAGRLVVGTRGGATCVAMQGRVHLYEGHRAVDVAFPARVLVAL